MSIRQHIFAGISPAIDDKHLDPRQSVEAHNTLLRDGTLKPFHAPLQVENSTSIRSLYLIRSTACHGRLLQLPKCAYPLDLPSPGSCHQFDQVVIFYKDGSTPPQRYLPCADDGAGEYAPLLVPAPTKVINAVMTTAGTIASNVDGAGPDARSYTYTWVDKFGIESPPAPPSTVLQSYDDETWTLSNFGAAPSNAVSMNIYRMTSHFTDGADKNSGDDSVSYQLVMVVPTPIPATYVDSARLMDLCYGTLMTVEHEPPPCMVQVSSTESGYGVGFKGSSVYFSERYEPHNWPTKYKITLKHRITGMAVFNDFIFIGTTGKPYRIHTKTVTPNQGAVELAAEVQEYDENYPCLSRGSMVATNFGAMFTSREGMVALQPRGTAQLITRPVVDQDDWMKYAPSVGCWFNGKYFGVRGHAGKGFIFDVKEGAEGKTDYGEFVTIDMNARTMHAGHNGVLYFAGSEGVFAWHMAQEFLPYTYRSKVFRQASRSLMLAAKVVADWGEPVTFTLYVDGKYVYQRAVTSSKPFRLPISGRGLDYQFELTGTTRVREVHIAPSFRHMVDEGKGGQQ